MTVAPETMSHEELVSGYKALFASHEELTTSHEELVKRFEELTIQNAWLCKELFGKRSERRVEPSSDARQLFLGEEYKPSETEPTKKTKVAEYERTHRKAEIKFTEEDSRLKFDERVPVKVIEVPHPDIEGLSEDEYEKVGEETCCKLAQLPGSYVVIKYVRPKIKIKDKISTAPLPPAARVIERGIAEVSFIVGLVIDKFVYGIPLYRQYQRLEASGVYVCRATLTHLVHRAAQILEPVFSSHLGLILLSHVLSMDETKMRAGRHKGKMHQGYFWGLLGENQEIAFLYSPTRSGKAVQEYLSSFRGTLLTDGYSVYDAMASQYVQIRHAQCWIHARRKFIEAEGIEPEHAKKALGFIRELYAIEQSVSREQRATYALPVVDAYFEWLRECSRTMALLPSNQFLKAVSYSLKREAALRVFLSDPKVSLDTNDLERENKRVAIGRKNYLFFSTEIGAKYGAILQSLVSTCILQGISPYDYLVDVLQRIESHPMSEVSDLTPRCWKEKFQNEPLRSDLQPTANLFQ